MSSLIFLISRLKNPSFFLLTVWLNFVSDQQSL